MTYLTDEVRLYEVVAEQVDENYGRLRGFIRRTILRDCVSELTFPLDDVRLGRLRAVSTDLEPTSPPPAPASPVAVRRPGLRRFFRRRMADRT